MGLSCFSSVQQEVCHGVRQKSDKPAPAAIQEESGRSARGGATSKERTMGYTMEREWWMNHEKAAELLQEFHYGKLEEATRHALSEHLAACEECEALSYTYRLLHATLQHDESGQEHPSSEEIVVYAVDHTRLAADAALRLADHVGSCAVCSDAVERTRKVHASVSRAATSGWRGAMGHPGFRAAMAAGIVLVAGLAVVNVTVQLRALQQLRNELAESQALLEELGRPSRGGAARLNVLSSSLRHAGEALAIPLPAGEPYILLAVEMDLAAFRPDAESFRFEILEAGGAAHWREELTAERVRGDVKGQGVVVLVVPTRGLATGGHLLRVMEGGEPLWEIPFELVTGE